MPTTSSAAARQLSDGNPQGTTLGRSGDVISFYGVTPVAQQAMQTTGTAISLGSQLASSAGFGFSTASMFNLTMSTIVAMQADWTALRAAMVSTGLFS